MIIRRGRKRHYTNVDNAVFEAGLSPEALGVLVYLLSRPDDWHVHLAQLARHFRIGRDRVQRIVRELIDARFALRRQTRAEDGRGFGRIEYVITEDRTVDKEATAADSETCSLKSRSHVQPENVQPEKPVAYLLLKEPTTDSERARFDQLKADWPSASDNLDAAWPVFKQLSEQQQVQAVDVHRRWRKQVADEGRTIFPTLVTYLRNRLWERLSAVVAARAGRAAAFWITQDDPRWPALAARYEREHRRPPLAKGSRWEPGIGFAFPRDWLMSPSEAA